MALARQEVEARPVGREGHAHRGVGVGAGRQEDHARPVAAEVAAELLAVLWLQEVVVAVVELPVALCPQEAEGVLPAARRPGRSCQPWPVSPLPVRHRALRSTATGCQGVCIPRFCPDRPTCGS